MVRPDHYGVEYEINPWMDLKITPDRGQAEAQWAGLHDLLFSLGCRIELAPGQPGLPDMVFTANAGLVLHSRVVLSRFRPRERRGETEYFQEWFREKGFTLLSLPTDVYFEGEGDALRAGGTLFTGYRWRSEARAHRFLSDALGIQVLPLELVDPHYYHLDTCFCPLNATSAVWYPPAFEEYGATVLKRTFPDLIPVAPAEAERFGCNAVVLDADVVLNTGCPLLERELETRGFRPHATPLDEFLKAGGAAKCLVLHLD